MALHGGHALRYGIRMAARVDNKYKSLRNSGSLRREEARGHINKLITNTAQSEERRVLEDLTILLAKSCVQVGSSTTRKRKERDNGNTRDTKLHTKSRAPNETQGLGGSPGPL